MIAVGRRRGGRNVRSLSPLKKCSKWASAVSSPTVFWLEECMTRVIKYQTSLYLEEEEADAEEDDPHSICAVGEEQIPINNVGGNALTIPSNHDGGGEEPIESNHNGDEAEEEPIQSVLAAFSKESLVQLLTEAADRHADVAARVRASADVEPSNRKIFVHGLKWDTTTETLFEEFAKFGEIEDCRVVTDKATGRSKGYGFVLFKTRLEARQALKEPQKLIDERMTSSQLASVGSIATAFPQKPVTEYTQRKIFVGNVGEDLDPEKLKNFFSMYGEIEEGPLGLDRETGKPRGFCLFIYKTVESAKLALREPHKQFEGVTLHCQQAIDGPKSHKGGAKNLQYVDNVYPSMVGTTIVPPPYMQMDPSAAVGQALSLLGAFGVATGMYNNSIVVPGGYGMGGVVNMGSAGLEGGWNQRGYPTNQMRRRGRGRGRHGRKVKL
ncbi:UBP1-associated protein 2A-like [Salvia hispanica]|uniref:UBP1-associated protein 2A-like n=1 Tax=Salvia hispanica TaxID=49212 RepID=UPI0020098D37|nr:UBP1-associated protein 2A-like [Salvia hispanica]